MRHVTLHRPLFFSAAFESFRPLALFVDGASCSVRWDEGTATLRMKMDLLSPNPNMWDHAAYRIMFSTHPHAKDGWCIYPTYDYTHCLVDSIENITHSMCTLEFETRQAKDGKPHTIIAESSAVFFRWSERSCGQAPTTGLSKRWTSSTRTPGSTLAAPSRTMSSRSAGSTGWRRAGMSTDGMTRGC